MKKKIYHIVWDDASSKYGWSFEDDVDDISETPYRVHSVGFIVKETSTSIVFSEACVPERNTWGSLHQIPKTMIKKKKLLAVLEL